MMYWTDNYVIEAAAMDGTQRVILAESLTTYTGLAIDTDGIFCYDYLFPKIDNNNNNA